MAAIDHGCRPGMEADRIPEIDGPAADVLPQQIVDIPSSGTEQSNDICGSVVARMRDSPARDTAVQQMGANGLLRSLQLFARGFSREFDELVKHRSYSRFSRSAFLSLLPTH